MSTKGMPVPHVEDVDEAVELLHQLHSAAENAVVEPDQIVTIGTLIASGALTGMSEGALVILAGVAQTAAAVYITESLACLSAVAAQAVKQLFANNELPDFAAEELRSQGFELEAEATA